ncbi:MAG: hypothetical protein RL701_7056 [Pseudomonadota bacterium]|jgi:hypothetical protein
MPYFKREPLEFPRFANVAQPRVATPLELVAATDALLARGQSQERREHTELTPAPSSLPSIVNFSDNPLVSAGSIPKLNFSAPVTAGESAQRSIHLRNDEAYPVDVHWSATDWLGDNGHVIPSTALSYAPLPLHVPAGAAESLTVSLQVPAHTPRGTYCALLAARGLPGTQAILSVEVV